MLSIFLAIAQTFIDSGFSQALIQKQNRTKEDFSTVFYTNLLVSVFAYILLYVSAPYIASFYDEPELIKVSRIVGLNLIIQALCIVQNVKIAIRLDYKLLTFASLISVFIGGGIGIIMAYKGYGVWALVFQSIISGLIKNIIIWFNSHWYPQWLFSIQSFKRLFGFGSKILCSTILHTVYLNMYTLVIGKFYDSSSVGFYNRANSLANFESINITNVIQRIYFPLLCEKQNSEVEFKNFLRQSLRLSLLIVMPVSILVAIFSECIIYIVFTEKWLPVAPLLSILSLAYILYPMLSLNVQVLQAKGYPNLFLKAEVYKKIFAIAILISTLNFGVSILCLGVLLYNIVDYAIVVYYEKKIMQTSFIEHLKWTKDIILRSILIAIVAYMFICIFNTSYVLQLFVGLPVCFLLYVITCINIEEGKVFTQKIKKYVKI